MKVSNDLINAAQRAANTCQDLADDLQRLQDVAPFWEVNAWRCRPRYEDGKNIWKMESNTETVPDWEMVPGIVQMLLEWQLEPHTVVSIPDPGPLHIRYVTD